MFGDDNLRHVSPEALEAIETVHRLFCNCGLTPFNRALKQVAFDFGLTAELRPDEAKEFKARALALHKWLGRRDYQSHRLRQLQEANFLLWVYRGYDCPDHGALDGLILPSSHAFWEHHTPANSWHCICGVSCTNSLAGAARLHGNPYVTLPSDWLKQSNQKGSPWFVPPEFRGLVHPGLSVCFEALEADHHISL